MTMTEPRIAVLLPCHNEAAAIGAVVRAFRTALPGADIYVFDNNSTDDTAAIARGAGAIVRREALQGKGHVVRRMFRDIQADLYVMADGDDTYDAALAPAMIELARRGPYDLVNCVRRETDAAAYRGGHRLGNRLLTGAVRAIFGDRVEDMLSGYKVLSRRFVKSFPVLATGFDIETELAVHALELALPIAHVEGDYRPRPAGSESKLRTWRDGWRILRLILRLLRHERPLAFFGALGAAAFLVAAVLIAPVIATYLRTGLVPRLPTAVLATGIVLAGALSLTTGIILDTVTRGRRETRLLAYLRHAAPGP
ncbi:MAG: glycosyltransferase [Rhodospirillales bacterium]|nr:glycosyltransferase [Rhodospirillales bacterium]